ncbi:hypothetical protein ACH4TI_15095 [Streptomyces rochei]|uniref:hypothetical protein n=1 Tax=Streptomyces rochei TaxID=1928 RepID=UPI0037932940
MQFTSGPHGFLNVEHVLAFEVKSVSSTSHLVQAHMVDGAVRTINNTGYPTTEEALSAIRSLLSGVASAAR